jgi:hypothetical protein
VLEHEGERPSQWAAPRLDRREDRVRGGEADVWTVVTVAATVPCAILL